MIGTTIGSYEIRAALGSGGMGEVYRARDSKLGRDVALKILPAVFSEDADRIARFRREAQVLASLSHAHIAAIHGLEESGGVPVLVLELVEGPTLADRLVHGAIHADEAYTIARQIADALDGAHAHGVIHRDLKPANIKLRPDGVVKVLDFGLAKALETAPGSDASMSPTITTPAMTRTGVILGTASYMSPEQARGLAVDRSSDIWAWGCVLFEMLTGTRAFGGTDTTEVIAAVIRATPDWSRLPSDTPSSVRRLLHRCLEKDPKKRLADIRDARFTLEDLATEVSAERVATDRRTTSREWLAWAAALLALVAAAAVWFWRAEVPAPAAREMRVEITTPPTTDPVSIALSPDGERVAFVASSEGRPMLWVRSLTTGEVAPLPNTDGASFPFWSPDSRSVAFFANDQLNRIGIDGGSFKALAFAPVGAGGSWSREDIILFTLVPDGPISRVAATGGTPAYLSDVTKREGGHRFPQFLPDGRHFLYFMAEAAKRGVYVGTIDGPDRRHLFDADTAAVFVPPAAIVFVRGGRLMIQRFDPATQILAGEPRAIAQGIVVDSTGAAAVSASATGAIIYRMGSANRQRQLVWFDRAGLQIGDAFPPDSDNPLNPRLSPDGRFAAMTRTVGGVADIWLQDLTRRGALTKLTASPTPDISPVWSPDGQRVASGSITPQGFSIAVTPLSGGQPATVFDAETQEIPADWTRDGRFILYRQQGLDSNVDLWAISTANPQQPFPVIQSMAEERSGAFSPDGRWVAFESNESGRNEIFVQSFPTPGVKTVVSTAGGRQVRWGASATELFYVAPDARLMSVSLTPSPDGRTVDAATPVPLFVAKILSVPVGGGVVEYDVTWDGKRFLMNTLVEHANSPITLILNAATSLDPPSR
jgi:serine/threonine protein kinase